MTLRLTVATPVDFTRVTSRPCPIAGNLASVNSAGFPAANTRPNRKRAQPDDAASCDLPSLSRSTHPDQGARRLLRLTKP
eukprot:1759692-Pyramimonas_sp.AAC.1